MNLNAKNDRTSRDYAMIGMVSFPILALVILLALSCLSWKANAARIRPILVERFSAERIDVPSPLADYYDERTSKKQSDLYRKLTASAGELTSRFYEIRQVIDRDDLVWTPELEQEVAKYTAEFAKESAPLIVAFDEIDFSKNPIWEPVEFEQTFQSYFSNRYSTDLDYLLRLNFEAALWSGDGERAIAFLERHRNLYETYTVPAVGHVSSWYLQWGQRMYRQVGRAIERGLWDADQLKSIDTLLTPVIDVPARWNVAIESEQLERVSWMESGQEMIGNEPEYRLLHTAPSNRLSSLENIQRLRQVSTKNAMQLSDRLEKASEERKPTSASLDTLLQFPSPATWDALDRDPWRSYHYFANALAAHETHRRLVRTAAVMVRFKDEFGDYPQQLSDLLKLNHPREEYQTMFNREFAIVDEDGLTKLVFATDDLSRSQKQTFNNGSSVDVLEIGLP